MRVFRVNAEISEEAFLKLMGEARRRNRAEGRGKVKYPIWRIIDDLCQSLPEPELDPSPEMESAKR